MVNKQSDVLKKTRIIIFLMILILIPLLIYNQKKRNSPEQIEAELRKNEHVDSFYLAQDIVKKQLKSPSTAIFGKIGECEEPYKDIDGVWWVGCYVDSQNGFGAMLRSNYLIKMKRVSGGKWDIIYQNIW
jgi:hypothetical protein